MDDKVLAVAEAFAGWSGRKVGQKEMVAHVRKALGIGLTAREAERIMAAVQRKFDNRKS